jgi:hypothetical protein
MFHDLDKTLEALLLAELSQEIRDQTSISFATPDADFPPATVSLPTINLFLYDVVENTEYRVGGHVWEPSGPQRFVRRMEPVRVACQYIVTAWARDGAPAPEQDEHQILGAAMRALCRHRKIPDEFLRGSLTGSEFTIYARPLANGRIDSPGEFWQALGGRPRPFFNYTAILAVPIFDDEVSTAAVEEAKVEVGRETPENIEKKRGGA